MKADLRHRKFRVFYKHLSTSTGVGGPISVFDLFLSFIIQPGMVSAINCFFIILKVKSKKKKRYIALNEKEKKYEVELVDEGCENRDFSLGNFATDNPQPSGPRL